MLRRPWSFSGNIDAILAFGLSGGPAKLSNVVGHACGAKPDHNRCAANAIRMAKRP